MVNRRLSLAILVFAMLATSAWTQAADLVHVQRTPDDGLEPQALVDQRGHIHVIYFKGDDKQGDLFYVHSADGSAFSKPIRVNSLPNSAMVIGAVRGAHLAIGKNNRPHVAWMGSSAAQSKSAPMLYTRLNDAGDAFEPQRNVIQEKPGLDGGGSIAADLEGNIYVGWHAPKNPGAQEGEAGRRVWIAVSNDDGKTFAREIPASDSDSGVCGCCAMKLFTDPRGVVFALYRSATEKIHRDMYLLRSENHGQTFASTKIASMQSPTCIMSTASFAAAGANVVAAWESEGQIYITSIDEKGNPSKPVPMPGDSRSRKHPALAINKEGQILVAWTEGTGWQKGGALAWQVFDKSSKPIEGQSAKVSGAIPVWGTPAAFVTPDGKFVIH